MRISDWSSDVCSSDLLRSSHHALRGYPSVVVREQDGLGPDVVDAGHQVVDAAFDLLGHLTRRRQLLLDRLQHGLERRADHRHVRLGMKAERKTGVQGKSGTDL